MKKCISILLSAIMMAATFISSVSVFAEGTTTVGGGRISGVTFVDEFENLDNVYSFDSQGGNWLAEKSEEVGTTALTGYRLVYKNAAAEPNSREWDIPEDIVLWYRAAEGKSITSAKYVIWYNQDKYNEGGRPAIKIKDTAGNITVLDAEWTKSDASEATGWSCKVTGTVSIPAGSEYVGLSFAKNSGVQPYAMAIDRAEFSLGQEISDSFFTESCDTLANTWSRTNLEVISGVVGTADYRVPYMWQQTTGSKPYEVVYKAAEGKIFNSVEAEITVQDNVDFPIIAYSFDGTEWIDLTVSKPNADWSHADWIVGGAPTPGANNNSGWTKVCKTRADEVVLPDGVKYIKFYSTTGVAQYQLYFRNIKLTTAGNEIFEASVTDDMSGTANMWRMVNLLPYSQINATAAATFDDSTLLALETVDKEASIIYKANEERAFTGINATVYTRDGGTTPDILVSKDGAEYTSVSPSFEISGKGGLGQNDAGWSDKKIATVSLDLGEEYKYIKILESGENAKQKIKFGDMTIKTSVLPEYRMIEPGYNEAFTDMENVYANKNFMVAGNEFVVTDSAQSNGETEAYITYQLADSKAFNYIKARFCQVDYTNSEAKVIALDKDMNELEWNQTGMWTTETDNQESVYTYFTLKAELPENTKYIKLLTNRVEGGWKSRISEVKFYEPVSVTSNLYQVTDGVEAQISEMPATGSNLKGTVSFYNIDLADKDIMVFGILREDGNRLKEVNFKPERLTEEGTVTLETPVLENCEITDKTTFEIIVVEKDTLVPVLPTKIVFD